VATDCASNGLCGVVVGDVVVGCEAGEPVEGSTASLSCCDGTQGEAALVHILDEWAEQKISFGIVCFLIPIVHVTSVYSRSGEKVHDVH
jgi:hypothetical protein